MYVVNKHNAPSYTTGVFLQQHLLTVLNGVTLCLYKSIILMKLKSLLSSLLADPGVKNGSIQVP